LKLFSGKIQRNRPIRSGFPLWSNTLSLQKYAAVATAALALSFAASSEAAVDINGGSSWGGWDSRGNSLAGGLWGSGSVTRSYDLYTSTFIFNNNAPTGGTQVRDASAPVGFAPGAFSTGAFANGNTILGIGLDLNGAASTKGSTFVTFGLQGNAYQPASALGATDGRADSDKWANKNDFVFYFDGTSGAGPTNLAVYTSDGTEQGGTGTFSSLRNAVSFDFATRMFRNGEAGGSIQMFFDLTAMQDLYGGGPNAITSGWTAGQQNIGLIGNNLNMYVYNDGGAGDGSRIAFNVGTGAVPEPGTWAMMIFGFGLAGSLIRRRRAGLRAA
jgi:hypothetical protein